jgi:hypothetical protein
MEHGDEDHLGGQILWRWRSHVNMGHTDSQLCVCRSYRFTSTCHNVFSAYSRSRPIDPSQCLKLNAPSTKPCSIVCLVQLVMEL